MIQKIERALGTTALEEARETGFVAGWEKLDSACGVQGRPFLACCFLCERCWHALCAPQAYHLETGRAAFVGHVLEAVRGECMHARNWPHVASEYTRIYRGHRIEQFADGWFGYTTGAWRNCCLTMDVLKRVIDMEIGTGGYVSACRWQDVRHAVLEGEVGDTVRIADLCGDYPATIAWIAADRSAVIVSTPAGVARFDLRGDLTDALYNIEDPKALLRTRALITSADDLAG